MPPIATRPEASVTAYDVAEIRTHFPALSVELDGRPLAYFDGPAGTQVPQGVIDAVGRYYREMNANHGGPFLTSRRSDEMADGVRAAAADFLGAASPDEIKFGPNMTTLTFHLSRSIGATLEPGDEVMITTLDHEANKGPWEAIARDRGLVLRTIDIRTEDATLDLADFERQLSSRTKLVAVGYTSNALGTVNPVAEIVRRAHAAGALTFVDAVAWAPHGPIDVRALGTDFLICSAYKFYGPHAGILYGRRELLDALPAYKVRPAFDRYETGTANYECLAGLGATFDHLEGIGRRYGGVAGGSRRDALVAAMTVGREHEMTLFGRLMDGFDAIPGLRVWGIVDRSRFDAERAPTVGITLEGVAPEAAAATLGARGIPVWDGHFYAQGLIERLGLAESGGVIRIGLAHYTTADEIDRLLGELDAIAANGRAAARGAVARA